MHASKPNASYETHLIFLPVIQWLAIQAAGVTEKIKIPCAKFTLGVREKEREREGESEKEKRERERVKERKRERSKRKSVRQKKMNLLLNLRCTTTSLIPKSSICHSDLIAEKS